LFIVTDILGLLYALRPGASIFGRAGVFPTIRKCPGGSTRDSIYTLCLEQTMAMATRLKCLDLRSCACGQ